MKLEEQVTSLELSKKLKELGVEQKGLFTWTDDPAKLKPYIVYMQDKNYVYHYSAFTSAELGEILNWKAITLFGLPDNLQVFIDDNINEANCRAKILIHLIENNLLKL
jgi:hypothetical protein